MHGIESWPNILIAFINFSFHLSNILTLALKLGNKISQILINNILHLFPNTYGSAKIIHLIIHSKKYLKSIHIQWLFVLIEQGQNQPINLLRPKTVAVNGKHVVQYTRIDRVCSRKLLQ